MVIMGHLIGLRSDCLRRASGKFREHNINLTLYFAFIAHRPLGLVKVQVLLVVIHYLALLTAAPANLLNTLAPLGAVASKWCRRHDRCRLASLAPDKRW